MNTLSKSQLFGLCLGCKVMYLDTNNSTYTLTGIGKSSYVGEYLLDVAESDQVWLKDCQLIVKRISLMTDEELKEFNKTKLSQGVIYETEYEIRKRTFHFMSWESFEWLITHGYLPDKYFDELKWAVESEGA